MLAFFDLFLVCNTRLCSAVTFSSLGNSDYVAIGSKGNVPFHSATFDYSCADWDGFLDHIVI